MKLRKNKMDQRLCVHEIKNYILYMMKTKISCIVWRVFAQSKMKMI